ncbi:MerR family transcriptional regulator [Proteiniborus sp.]|uniref:MerR family transcriptional regulator n=1 Tax=Proteiniborus sp. TaxID=2079015 RepID=UPI00332F38BF
MYDAEKEYTISEVSELTGYPAHVIRYYEKEFELDIPRNNANHRYYTYKELEIYNYIKALQEKGFTNKQIKLIMSSPEILVSNGETAVTTLFNKETEIVPNTTEICRLLKELISEELRPILIEKADISLRIVTELKDEVTRLRNEISNNERDVLICENIKLKMKIKEKSYEVVELKDKLKKEQEANKGIFTKFFGRK